MGVKHKVVHLSLSLLLTSLALTTVRCQTDSSHDVSTEIPAEQFPTDKCEATLRGCECYDFDELVGIYCANISDFRTHAELLENGSVFELNTTYEISLTGIRSLAPRSFRGLIVFRVTIDDPNFERLEDGVFDTALRIRRFQVRSSSIKDLPDFRVMKHSLRNINVDHSRLETLDGPYLQGLTLMEVLSFSDNAIENVHPDVFKGTDNVMMFDVSYNRITTLPPHLFDTWKKLVKVVVSHNRLVHLDGLFAVARPKFLYMDFNNLTDVDSILYPNMTEVDALLLASNPISRITEHSFNGKINSVRFLYMDHCHVREFDVRHYRDLVNLSTVDLSWNRIERIGEQKIDIGNKLEIDLIGNQISAFEAEIAFTVRRLYMSQNRLAALGKTLQFSQIMEVSVAYNRLEYLSSEDLHGAHGMENVQLQGNRIGWVDRDTFVMMRNDLHNLDLSANRMTSLNGSVRFLSQLKSLNVSDNLIQYFEENEFIGLNELSELYLQRNKIAVLGGLLDQLPQLQYFVISNNDIRNIQVEQVPQRLQYLYFKDNPFVCDCKLHPFLHWLNKSSSPGTDVEICAPLADDATPKSVEHRSLSCPAPCTCSCTKDGGAYFMMVDCNSRNMSLPPAFLSTDGWNKLEDYSAIMVRPQRRLVFRQNVDPRFLVQDRVLGLDLDNNSFDSMQGWNLPTDLRLLYLANNRLRSVPESVFNSLRALRKVTFSGNPWTCDCTAGPFKKWLLSKMDIVLDVNVTRCYSKEDTFLNGKVLVSLSDVEICPPDIAFYTALSFGLLSFLLLCAALKITYTRYEMNIKVWLYSHGVSWVKEKDIDKDKIFDAFISFSHQDESFVADEIVAVLESKEPNMKLCLHYRNFLPGEFIHQNILNAVKNSKRTVLVLSRNFLESEWCLMEFRAAHLQALEDKVHRIIVIKVGDLPKDIDPSIKVYLDSTTYVIWGEKYFWQKLLYALPTSSAAASRRGRLAAPV